MEDDRDGAQEVMDALAGVLGALARDEDASGDAPNLYCFVASLSTAKIGSSAACPNLSPDEVEHAFRRVAAAAAAAAPTASPRDDVVYKFVNSPVLMHALVKTWGHTTWLGQVEEESRRHGLVVLQQFVAHAAAAPVDGGAGAGAPAPAPAGAAPAPAPAPVDAAAAAAAKAKVLLLRRGASIAALRAARNIPRAAPRAAAPDAEQRQRQFGRGKDLRSAEATAPFLVKNVDDAYRGLAVAATASDVAKALRSVDDVFEEAALSIGVPSWYAAWVYSCMMAVGGQSSTAPECHALVHRALSECGAAAWKSAVSKTRKLVFVGSGILPHVIATMEGLVRTSDALASVRHAVCFDRCAVDSDSDVQCSNAIGDEVVVHVEMKKHCFSPLEADGAPECEIYEDAVVLIQNALYGSESQTGLAVIKQAMLSDAHCVVVVQNSNMLSARGEPSRIDSLEAALNLSTLTFNFERVDDVCAASDDGGVLQCIVVMPL